MSIANPKVSYPDRAESGPIHGYISVCPRSLGTQPTTIDQQVCINTRQVSNKPRFANIHYNQGDGEISGPQGD